MRKIVLAAAALLLVLPLAGHAGVTVNVNRQFSMGYNDSATSTNVSMVGYYVFDAVTGNVSYTYVYIGLGTPSGYDGGSGTNVVVDVDPLLMQGTISGSVQGNNGPITFNFAYLGTRISTDDLTYAGVEPVPADPSVNAAVLQTHQGRVSGPVSSPVAGSVTVPNGSGYVTQYTTADARP